ncbi:MAG: type IX secretion system membrane protein PorP/SprF, partial [Muribaculaceae bacterium]|nr:type IX secretion system membrane protein PorP/SprF [Muribaculaceae bacterium]
MEKSFLTIRLMAFMAGCFIIAHLPTPVRGQSDPLYTQAWALPTLYNPAAAGSTDFLRIRGAARMQWVGIKNAPKSFTGAADIPFKLLGRRWGGGVNLTQEGIGLFNNTYVNGQVSGRLKKLFGGDLTIGLQVGYFGSSFRGSD